MNDVLPIYIKLNDTFCLIGTANCHIVLTDKTAGWFLNKIKINKKKGELVGSLSDDDFSDEEEGDKENGR